MVGGITQTSDDGRFPEYNPWYAELTLSRRGLAGNRLIWAAAAFAGSTQPPKSNAKFAEPDTFPKYVNTAALSSLSTWKIA